MQIDNVAKIYVDGNSGDTVIQLQVYDPGEEASDAVYVGAVIYVPSDAVIYFKSMTVVEIEF